VPDPIVQRPDVQVRIGGVPSAVVPVQDAAQQMWLFPLVSLSQAMGLTVTPGADAFLLSISQDVDGQQDIVVVLTYSLDGEGMPTDILLWKNNVVTDAPGVTLILFEGVLYASVEFVQFGLDYAVAVNPEGTAIDLTVGWMGQ